MGKLHVLLLVVVVVGEEETGVEDDVCIATEVVLGSAGQEGGLAGEQTRGLTSVM